jgi:hypothetical protein
MDAEPLVSRFTGDLDDVVTRYCDQGLTVSEAIGALELVKAKIIKDALEAEDGE